MGYFRIIVMATIVFSAIVAGAARGDEAKVNTPVVTAMLQGDWELRPDQQGAFRQMLRLGPMLTGEWWQSQPSLPVTIAWFVEGHELRMLHYDDPTGKANYRVKTIMVGYELSDDTMTMTLKFDGKPTKWVRLKVADQ